MQDDIIWTSDKPFSIDLEPRDMAAILFFRNKFPWNSVESLIDHKHRVHSGALDPSALPMVEKAEGHCIPTEVHGHATGFAQWPEEQRREDPRSARHHRSVGGRRRRAGAARLVMTFMGGHLTSVKVMMSSWANYAGSVVAVPAAERAAPRPATHPVDHAHWKL